MKSNDQKQLLRYGQIINLFGKNLKRHDAYGVLMGKGFTDNSVFLFNFRCKEKIGNARKTYFQILPKGDFLIHDEYLKKQSGEEKKLLESRRKREMEQYQALTLQKQGEPITFNSEVIFMHYDAEMYISSSQTCSQSSTDAYKLKLKSSLSSAQLFTILPVSGYEKAGDFITFSDPVLLVNSKTKCYLEFSCTQRILLDEQIIRQPKYKKLLQKYKIERPDLKKNVRSDRRLEATIANNQSSQWYFWLVHDVAPIKDQQNFQDVIDPDQIYVQDLVELYHDQEEGQFTVNDQSKVVLKIKRNKESQQAFNGFWKIEYTQADSNGPEMSLISYKNSVSPSFLIQETNQEDENNNDQDNSQASKIIQKKLSQDFKMRIKSEESQGYIPTEMYIQQLQQQQQQQQQLLSNKLQKAYKLRHYQTGKILCVNRQDKNMVATIHREDDDQYEYNNQLQINMNIYPAREQNEELQNLSDIKTSSQTTSKVNQEVCQNLAYIKIGFDNRQLDLLQMENFNQTQFNQKQQQSDNVNVDQPKRSKQEIRTKLRKLLVSLSVGKSFQNKMKEIHKEIELSFVPANNKHAFKIVKITKTLRLEILFIESSMELLTFFSSLLQAQESCLKQLLTLDLLRKIIKVIKQLIAFMINCDRKNIFHTLNQPIKRRQNQLVDNHIPIILSEMLCLIKERAALFENNPQIGKKIRKLFSLIYTFIELVVQGNKQTKAIISQCLQLYLAQALEIPEPRVRECLQEIIKNNEDAIIRLITPDRIKDLIARIHQQLPQQVYPKVLSLLCVCGDKALSSNQNQVIDKFFKHGQPQFLFRFKWSEESDEYYKRWVKKMNEQKKQFDYPQKRTVLMSSSLFRLFKKVRNQQKDNEIVSSSALPDSPVKGQQVDKKLQLQDQIFEEEQEENLEEWMLVSEFFDYCSQLQQYEEEQEAEQNNYQGLMNYGGEKENYFGYFLEFINLLSNCCKNRNKAGKTYVDSIINFDISLYILQDPLNAGLKLFRAFMRLVLHAYVDQPPYSPINYYNNIQIWESLDNDQDIVKTQHPIPQNIKNIIKYTEDKIIWLQNQIKDVSFVNMALLYERISIFLLTYKTFLRLGLMESMNQILLIVPYLLKIMSFHQELCNKKLHSELQQQLEEIDVNKTIVAAKSIGDGTEKDLRIMSNRHAEDVINLIKLKNKHRFEANRIIECKCLAAHIIEIIMKMDYNINVIKILKYFKTHLNNFNRLSRSNHGVANISISDLFSTNKWLNFLRNGLQERHIFQQTDRKEMNIELIFTELTLFYENSQLQNQGQKLLNRLYSQRKEVMRQIYKINLVIGENGHQLVDRGNQVKLKLSILKDKNILYATYENQKDYNYNLFCNALKNQTNNNNNISEPSSSINLNYQPDEGILTEQRNQQQNEQQLQQRENIDFTVGKRTGIIQDLYYLACNISKFTLILKQQRNPPPLNYDDLNSSKSILVLMNERDTNFEALQNLYFSQELHKKLIKFIKIAQHVSKESSLVVKTLHAVYYFLTVLIWNNPRIKLEFVEYRQLFFAHLKMNVACAEFLRELYTNQKYLLSDEKEVRSALQVVLQACMENTGTYYRAILFDVMRSFLLLNGKALKTNQTLIINCLQGNKYSPLLIFQERSYIDNQKIEDHQTLINWIREAEQAQQEAYSKVGQDNCQTTIQIELSPQITYFISYFSIFSLLVGNRNEATTGICQKMHSFSYLASLIKESLKILPVKRTLRCYLNALYYTEISLKDYLNPIINIDLDNIIYDLSEYIEIESKKPQVFQDIQLKYSVHFAYYSTYSSLNIMDISYSLNQIFSNTYLLKQIDGLIQNKLVINLQESDLIEQQSDQQQLVKKQSIIQFDKFFIHSKIIEIVIRLMQILKIILEKQSIARKLPQIRFQTTLQTSINKVLVFLMGKIKQFPSNVWYRSQTIKSIQQQFIQQLQLQDKSVEHESNCISKQSIKENVFLSQLTNDYDKLQKTLLYQDQNPPLRRKDSIKEEYQVVNEQFKKVIQFIRNNQQIQFFINEESLIMQNEMLNLENHSFKFYNLQNFGFPLLSEKKYIKALIDTNIQEPESLPRELRQTFLDQLIYRVRNKNQDSLNISDYEIDEWETDYWVKYKDAVNSEQVGLKNIGAVSLVCSILSEQDLEQNLELADKNFLFGIALLLGGNTEVQNEFYNIFSKDKNNTILLSIQHLLKHFAKQIIKKTKLENPNKALHIRQDGKEEGNQKKNDSFDHSLKSHNLYDHCRIENLVLRMYQGLSDNDYLPLESTDTVEEKEQKMKKQEGQQQSEENFDDQETDQREAEFYQHSKKILQRAFRFTQLLCENNNIQMKKFLVQQQNEDQSFRPNNINLIQEANTILRKFLKQFNPSISQIPIFIANFLIEISQFPCAQNQISLCKSTFFDDICALSIQISELEQIELKQPKNAKNISNQQLIEDACEIQSKSIEAAISISEGENVEVVTQLTRKLDQQFLIVCISRQLDEMNVKSLQEFVAYAETQPSMFNEHLNTIFNVLRLRNMLYDHGYLLWCILFDDQVKAKDNNKGEFLEILNYIQKKLLLQMEIEFDNKIHKIQFPNHPLFIHLGKNSRTKLMLTVSRTTHRDKIIGLINYRNDAYKEMEHNFKLSQLTISLTSDNIDKWRNISITISLILNLFLIFFSTYEVRENAAYINFDNYEMLFIQIVSIAQLESSIILLIIFIINRYPLTMKTNDIKQTENPSWLQNITYYTTNFFRFLIKDEDIIYLLFFVFSAFLGVFYKITYFVLQLPYAIGRFSIIKEVYDSVYNAIFSRIRLLILVFILGLTYVFVLSIISFDNYVTQVYSKESDSSKSSQNCQTIYSCMMHFILSGNLGAFKHSNDAAVIIFDTIYQIFFIMLFLNIITGILLDTFAQTRETRNAIEFDKMNKCYICGMEKNEIEKQNYKFDNHIHKRHYLWNYIFFIYCIEKKQITEYTGMEYWIKNLIDQEDIRWVPMLGQSDDALLQKMEDTTKILQDQNTQISEKIDKAIVIAEGKSNK